MLMVVKESDLCVLVLTVCEGPNTVYNNNSMLLLCELCTNTCHVLVRKLAMLG